LTEELKNKDSQLRNKDNLLQKLKKQNEDLSRNYFKTGFFLFI
jgi:hypothetical protein